MSRSTIDVRGNCFIRNVQFTMQNNFGQRSLDARIDVTFTGEVKQISSENTLHDRLQKALDFAFSGKPAEVHLNRLASMESRYGDGYGRVSINFWDGLQTIFLDGLYNPD